LLSKFGNLYVVGLGVAFFYALLIPGYLGQVPSRIFSYYVNDGTCDPKIQGVGIHCFGDFYYNVATGNLDNPWASIPNPNPPLMQMFYEPFSSISTNSRSGLLIYLLLMLILCLTPFIFMHRKKIISGSKINQLFLLFLTCSPTLIAFDRGSFSIVFFPLTFFLLHAHINHQYKTESFLLVLMVALKPQMIFFNLILLRHQSIKKLGKITIIQVLFVVLTFLLYSRNLFDMIKFYLNQVLRYQEYTSWGSLFPLNLSLTNFIGTPLKIFEIKQDFLHLRGLLTILLILIVVYKLFKYKRTLSNLEFFTLVSLSIILLPGVTFAYYLSLLMTPILFGIVCYINKEADEIKFISKSNLSIISGLVSLILLFIPWTIPTSSVLPESMNLFAFAEVGLNWYPGVVFLHLFFLSALVKAGKT
jgi:hypothetical protein